MTLLSMPLGAGQELPPPIPGEEAPRAVPVAPKAEPAVPATPAGPAEPKRAPQGPIIRTKKVPLGVREVKPQVPTTERLIRDSETTLVDGDQMWLTIDHARGMGESWIDVDRSGWVFLVERKQVDGQWLPPVVRGGKGVPEGVRKAMLDSSRRKGVLYGIGRDRLVGGGSAERLKLGVAARLGRSVHTSQSFPFDNYPEDVRLAARTLLESARSLPVIGSAKGVVSAEFVPPQEARRLTVIGGSRLIAVRDPGAKATVLSPVVAAARMPGRKVIVTDELHWEQIQSYLTGGGTGEAGTRCLIAVGSQVYRLSVSAL